MCWIPSHCGLLYNEIADQLARNGSKNKNSIKININLSQNEMFSIIEKQIKNNKLKSSFVLCPSGFF